MRKLSVSVFLNSNCCPSTKYEPAPFPVRGVVSLSTSFSPFSPMSLPMVKPNRCSVSISSARTGPAQTATSTKAHAPAHARQWCVTMKSSCLANPNSADSPSGLLRDGSDQRQRSGWTVGEDRPLLGKHCRHGERDGCAGAFDRCGNDYRRQRTGQCMQGAALVVQVEDAVMMIRIRIS